MKTLENLENLVSLIHQSPFISRVSLDQQRTNGLALTCFPVIFPIFGLFSRVSSCDHHWEEQFKRLIDS